MTEEKEEDNDEGNISRCPHDSDHPFTMISNTLLRNQTLSFEALGLLCHLLSHSKSWKSTQSQIQKNRKIGKDKVKRIFEELILQGYMKVFYYRGRKGYRNVKYTFSETSSKIATFPTAENPLKVQPNTETILKKIVPSAENPTLENPHCLEDHSCKKRATAIDNAREEESSKNAAACSFENADKGNSQAVDEKTSSLALEQSFDQETTSKAAASLAAEKATSAAKVEKPAAIAEDFVCHINTKFSKEVTASVREWIKLSLEYEKDKFLIRAVVAKFNATEVGTVKSVRMWLTDMLHKMSPVELDDEGQAPAKELKAKAAAALFEKVNQSLDADTLSQARAAINIALESYEEGVVAMSIEDMNAKKQGEIRSWKALFPHICSGNKFKEPRKIADSSQLQRRIAISKCLCACTSNGGSYTFDEKKLYFTSGALTKEYNFTGNDYFWSEKEKFCNEEATRRRNKAV